MTTDRLWTLEKKSEFLDKLRETCNVTRAANMADVSRSQVYLWREIDELFAEGWERALKVGAEALEDEARRRAFEGVLEPVFHLGQEVATIRKYSDTLAIFLLKGALPDKYRENSKVELTGNLNVTSMSDEEILAELSLLKATISPNEPDEIDDCSDLA
jgi:hypothetical protein